MSKIKVPHLARVSAGTPVPTDWKKWLVRQFREIRPIDGAEPFDKFASVDIEGESMTHLGILHGDVLIFRITQKYERSKIGIWQTPHGLTAKYAEVSHKDNCIVLDNRFNWKKQWSIDDVKLLGLVVRVERDMD